MRHTSRTQTENLSTRHPLEHELEKWGAAWDTTPEEREDYAAFAERRGYHAVAQRLRDTNARRHGWHRPDLTVVPDDGRRRLASRPDRPILVGLPGGEDAPVAAEDPATIAWGRLARSAEHSLLSLPLRPHDAAEIRAFVEAARHAAEPLPERSA